MGVDSHCDVQLSLVIKNHYEGYFLFDCCHFLAFCYLSTAFRKQLTRSIHSKKSYLKVGSRLLVS